MTNEAYTMYQTNAERAVIKNSSFHKKNGSAVAKLGNKPMTNKEIAAKHGKCVEFDLANFMVYDEFKKMAPDLEAEYVNKLCDRYGIRMEHISEHLFHAGKQDLMSRLKIVGVYKQIVQKKTTEVSEDSIKQFKDDVELWEEREANAKVIDLAEATRKKKIIENAEFITYDEFKTFTVDEQVKYINSVISKYSVSMETVGRELFKISRTALEKRFESHDVVGQIKKCGRYGRAAIKPNKAFHDAVAAWRGEPIVEEIKYEPKRTPITHETDAKEVAADVLSTIIDAEQNEPKISEENKPTVEPVFQTDPDMVKQQLDDLNEKFTSELMKPVTVGEILDQLDVPKLPEINIEYTPFPVPEKPSEMSFSANYISESGLDEHQLYALISLFQDKKVNVSIDIKVVTS